MRDGSSSSISTRSPSSAYRRGLWRDCRRWTAGVLWEQIEGATLRMTDRPRDQRNGCFRRPSGAPLRTQPQQLAACVRAAAAIAADERHQEAAQLHAHARRAVGENDDRSASNVQPPCLTAIIPLAGRHPTIRGIFTGERRRRRAAAARRVRGGSALWQRAQSRECVQASGAQLGTSLVQVL